MYNDVDTYRAIFDDFHRAARRLFNRIDWVSMFILMLCMLIPGILGSFFGVLLYVQFFAG